MTFELKALLIVIEISTGLNGNYFLSLTIVYSNIDIFEIQCLLELGYN
jgi:hypothetical protein